MTMRNLLILLTALLFASCSPRIVKQIEYRDSVRTEYKAKIDTIKLFSTDSVVVKNDSIVFRLKTIYKDHHSTDTIFVDKTINHNIEIIKEKQLTFWESVKINFGGYSLLFNLLTLIYLAFRIYKRFF